MTKDKQERQKEPHWWGKWRTVSLARGSQRLCQTKKSSSPFMSMDSLANLPKALHGENFRSYVCRWVNLQALPTKQRRAVRSAMLTHFRKCGMDVEACAVKCVTAINMHLAGLGQ